MNLNVPEDARNQFLNHQDWIYFFGNGEEGWYSFVDYYHFNPYVNNKYEVKVLFAPYEQYSKKDCNEVVGTYHDWDYCLPRCSKDDHTVPITDAKKSCILLCSQFSLDLERNKLMKKLLT